MRSVELALAPLVQPTVKFCPLVRFCTAVLVPLTLPHWTRVLPGTVKVQRGVACAAVRNSSKLADTVENFSAARANERRVIGLSPELRFEQLVRVQRLGIEHCCDSTIRVESTPRATGETIEFVEFLVQTTQAEGGAALPRVRQREDSSLARVTIANRVETGRLTIRFAA